LYLLLPLTADPIAIGCENSVPSFNLFKTTK